MKAGWNADLERLLRRADPVVRVIPEAAVITAEDVRHRDDELGSADTAAGFETRGDGGLALAASATVRAEITTHTTLLELLSTGDSEFYAAITYPERDAAPEIAQVSMHLVSQVIPESPKEVARWKLEMFALRRERIDGDFDLLSLAPICDPVLVDAAGTTTPGDVVFDYANGQATRPRFPGAPEYQGPVRDRGEAPEVGGMLFPFPTILARVRALKADGTPAANAGLAVADPPTSSTGPFGLTLHQLSRAFQQRYPGEYWHETEAERPRMAVTTRTYTPATVSFTGARKIDLESTPTAGVELVGEGDTPGLTSIVYELKADDGTWVRYRDGDLAATDNTRRGGSDLSPASARPVSQRQYYEMRATLYPGIPAVATPVLRGIGARAVEVIELDGLATISGGLAAVDPRPAGKGEISELTLSLIRDGQRDYRDVATALFSEHDTVDITIRLWLGHPALPRERWMLLETYGVDDFDPRDGSIEVTCLSCLALTDTVVPPPVVSATTGHVTRSPLVYANATLPAAFQDLLDGQVGLPERYRGPGIPASITATVSKRVGGSATDKDNGKTELDAVAYLAGGAMTSSQGRVRWVDLHGSRAVAAVLGREDFRPVATPPGMRQRVPEFFVPYGWVESADGAGGSFDDEVRSFNLVATARLGSAGLDAPRVLDEPVARWIDTQALAELTASRVTRSQGAGLPLWTIAPTYPHPELEVGDRVAVETDQFVAKDAAASRALKGMLWATAVVVAVHDPAGTAFDVWIRDYSDLVPATEVVNRAGYGLPSIVDFRVLSQTDEGRTYTWSTDGEPWGAYRVFTEPLPFDPWSLVDADVARLPDGAITFTAPLPAEKQSVYVKVEARRVTDLALGGVGKAVITGTPAPIDFRAVPTETATDVTLTVSVADPRGVVTAVVFYTHVLGVRSGPLAALTHVGPEWSYTLPLDPKHPVGIQPEILRLDGGAPILGEVYSSDIGVRADVKDVRQSTAGTLRQRLEVDGDTDTVALFYREVVDAEEGAEVGIPARAGDGRFGAVLVDRGALERELHVYGRNAVGDRGDEYVEGGTPVIRPLVVRIEAVAIRLMLFEVTGQTALILGDFHTQSVRCRRADRVPADLDYWEEHADGASLQVLVPVPGAETWLVAADVFAAARLSVTIDTPTDSAQKTVEGPLVGGGSGPLWAVFTAEPPANLATEASIVLKASSAPSGFTAEVWYQHTAGAGWSSWAEITSSLGPPLSSIPLVETTYTYDTTTQREDGESGSFSARFRADIKNGSGEVVRTQTMMRTWSRHVGITGGI